MVYYSPYKQIWRAFKRAIRTFISSLVTKRLLFMIIVALVIMLLHLNVHAESIHTNGYAYRDIKYIGYDNSTDCYKYSYRVYTRQGLKEGELLLPSNFYNNKVWFINISNNGEVRYWYNTSNVSEATFYINNYGSSTIRCSWNAGGTKINNLTWYMYDFDSNTWNINGSITNNQDFILYFNGNDTIFDPARYSYNK